MKNVAHQKYLGFTLSEDGCNVKNIIEKQKRANGIIREIQFLIKGLGKFTFEGAMIYLNSLLRSSILFAAEAMYNVKENELRLLERKDFFLLKKYLIQAGDVLFINHILNLDIYQPDFNSNE